MLLTKIALLSASLAHAVTGGFDGGGGDPYATDFLKIADRLQQAQVAGQIDLGVPAIALENKIAEMRASLEGQNPLIEFPAGETVICFGAEKLGCVEDSGRVRVAREGWEKADPKVRLKLVAMELTKATNGKNRYEVASSVDRVLVQTASFALGEQMGKMEKPIRPTSIFNDCKLYAINAAMKSESGRTQFNVYPHYSYWNVGYYPQFDFAANDGLENLQSFYYRDNEDPNFYFGDIEERDPNDKRPVVDDDLRKDVLMVSWIRGKDGKLDEGFGPTTPKAAVGQRAFVSATTLAQDEDDNDASYDCAAEALDTHSVGSAVAFEKWLSENKDNRDYNSLASVPKKFREITSRPANQKIVNYFSPCVREALNTALRRAANDQAFFDMFGRTPFDYKLESGYRLKEKGADGSEDILINLRLRDFYMSLPVSYRLIGRENADGSCTVIDVRDR